MRYVALITKIGDYYTKHFVRSHYGESKESFIERISKAYIKRHETPYWEVNICELGELVCEL
jgi:hypothetical protein